MPVKHFEGIFRSGRIKGFKAGDELVRDFFRDKAMSTRWKKSTRTLIERPRAQSHAVNVPTPGKMMLYEYDAKHKDTLPYWDKFPVIFPLELYKDGFLGINLHYLPPVFRARLMDALYETLNNDKFDDTSKLTINYQILKNASKMRYFKPCIKQYLYSHVKSSMVEIPINEWDFVVFLPVQKFMKAPQRQVWDDSIKMIMGN